MINFPFFIKIFAISSRVIPDAIKENAEFIDIKEVLFFVIAQWSILTIFQHRFSCLPEIEYTRLLFKTFPGLPVKRWQKWVDQRGKVICKIGVVSIVKVKQRFQFTIFEENVRGVKITMAYPLWQCRRKMKDGEFLFKPL